MSMEQDTETSTVTFDATQDLEWASQDYLSSKNCSNVSYLSMNCDDDDWLTSDNGSNITSEDFQSKHTYYFYETEQFILLWFLLVSIIVGNLAVIGALYLSKSRKSRTNFFISHLAIADLLVGLVSVLTDIVWKITVEWKAGAVMCKLVKFGQQLVTYSSTYVLVALSIDRYDAITHPMNFSGSWRRARYLIRGAWVISIVFASPSLYLFEQKNVEGVTQCWADLEQWQWRVYVVSITLLVFIIPFLIITGCYAIIVHTIWSKSKTMIMNSVHNSSQNGGKRSGRRDVGNRVSSRGLIPKAKIKTVKMTLVIVFAFVLCWSPYCVFNILSVFDFFLRTQTMIAISTFINSLAPLNSAANPVIYCLFSTRLCRNLRKITMVDYVVRHLFPCCGCTKKPIDPHAHIIRSDYTTMSEISSKRPTISSIRSMSSSIGNSNNHLAQPLTASQEL